MPERFSLILCWKMFFNLVSILSREQRNLNKLIQSTKNEMCYVIDITMTMSICGMPENRSIIYPSTLCGSNNPCY